MSLNNIQMASLGATVVAQGSMWGMMSEFIEANHVTLAFFVSVFTFLIFGFAALWNAHSNHKLKRTNRRQIIDDIVYDMRQDGKSEEEIEKVLKYARH